VEKDEDDSHLPVRPDEHPFFFLALGIVMRYLRYAFFSSNSPSFFSRLVHENSALIRHDYCAMTHMSESDRVYISGGFTTAFLAGRLISVSAGTREVADEKICKTSSSGTATTKGLPLLRLARSDKDVYASSHPGGRHADDNRGASGRLFLHMLVTCVQLMNQQPLRNP
jgi:hypothetical protein